MLDISRARKIGKRLGGLALLGLVVLTGVVSWNCWTFRSRQLQIPPLARLALDESALLGRLQGAVKIETISQSMAKLTTESELHRFRSYVIEEFPELRQPPFVLRTGGDLGDDLIPSLLLEWPGQDPSLLPILLMSHFDVVPVAVGSQAPWTHPPFSGHIDDEFIWGRGTLDCKHGVLAILEALRLHQQQGFQPVRTIYVALGHDEELGGGDGNAKMAQWLRSHGKRLHLILDEGGCIFTEFPGLDRPAALIGVAEKGMLNIQLTVDVEASEIGHASMPPAETSIGILAAAVQRVQAAPFPPRIDVSLRDTLKFIGPEMPAFFNRLAVSNLWLFEPLVVRKFSAKPSSNALLRTTVAPTLIAGGVQVNVLPPHAEAALNLRLMPGEDLDSVTAHLSRVIDDHRVRIGHDPHFKQPSRVSKTDSTAFQRLHHTIAEIYPDVVVAPFVLVGSTDTTHYSDDCDNILRFIPARLSERDTQRFHGTDERIAINDYLDMVRFFHRFISNTTSD